MTDVILGQYLPGDSPVHRLDPRTKILLSVFWVTLVFLVDSVSGYAGLILFTVAALTLARLPFSYLYRGMRPILFFAAFTFLFQLAFVQSGPLLWRLGPLVVTAGGWESAWAMALRLLLVVSLVLLVTLTTAPVELSDGLERLLRPLRPLGLNSYEVALVASGALRFVPTLLEQAEKVKRAQMARGVNFSQGNLWVRARKMFPLLVPLFVGALRRAEDLALALEARGYRGGAGRVPLREYHLGWRDALAWVVSLLTGAVLVWL